MSGRMRNYNLGLLVLRLLRFLLDALAVKRRERRKEKEEEEAFTLPSTARTQARVEERRRIAKLESKCSTTIASFGL